MIKKIMIVPVLMISLGFIGCGESKSVLLNENYLKPNWDNNYEEVKIKAENLDDEQFEVILDEDSISITDKKIKSVDKIEYKFGVDGEIQQVSFRSNSKDVKSTRRGTAYFFYIDDDKMVDSKETQIDFLNGKIIPDEKIIKIDQVLLDAYSGLGLESFIHQTRAYLELFQDEIYKIEQKGFKEGESNELSLMNTKTNSEVIVYYADKSNDDDTRLPINKIKYVLEDGKIIEINVKNRGEVENFKVYNKGQKEGKEVASFGEQVNFLKGK